MAESELEGILSGVNADGSNGFTINVNGVLVRYMEGNGNKLSTPAGPLTVAQMLQSGHLPGRTGHAGFEGGTAIVLGDYDLATNQLTASELTVEPGESVLLGIITRNDSGPPRQIEINKVPIRFLDDPRMPAGPPVNEFGFEIELSSLTEGMPATAEGYYAEGNFHTFLLQVDDPSAALVTSEPQIAITRGESRDRGAEFDVDVRGAITTTHTSPGQTQRIDLYRVDSDPTDPNVEIESRLGGLQVEVVAGGFTRWRFDERVTAGPGNTPLGDPPRLIRAYNQSTGAITVSEDFEMEVRELDED